MTAPAALSLIAVTFPEGPRRNRAVAVYSAMFILGVVVGLIAGGLLVTYANWRWVFFVNVPIGLAVAALATRVLPATGRRAGRFDLPGAITATAGVAAAPAQPGPVRGVPDQLVRRYRAAGHVLLPDDLPAGGVGVQRAADRGGLPTLRSRDLGDDGGRAAG